MCSSLNLFLTRPCILLSWCVSLSRSGECRHSTSLQRSGVTVSLYFMSVCCFNSWLCRYAPPSVSVSWDRCANGLPAETCQLIQILEALPVVLHFKRPVIRIKSDDRHKLLYPNGCTCDVNQSTMNAPCIILTMLS
jgi:hypothetical protein